MISIFRVRRYRTLIIFAFIGIVIVYQLTASKPANVVPAKFMRPASQVQRSGSPPMKLGSESPHSVGRLEVTDQHQQQTQPEHQKAAKVEDINLLLEAEDESDQPSAKVKPHTEPGQLTAKSYDSTYSPDDHRLNSDSITTPRLPKVVDVFSSPRLTHFPSHIIPLPKGTPQTFPRIQATFQPGSVAEERIRLNRLTAVRDAFLHSWNGYKAHAWGHDELRPVSNEAVDPFGGWGATIFDAIDTLEIMGLTAELSEAKQFVATTDFTKSNFKTVPVFETTIRYLGGLIGAYDVSKRKDPMLLRKAVELADLLIGAFDTPNGMPILFYDPVLAHHEIKLRAGKHMIFSQFASLSLEFTRLAQLTANNTYFSAIQRITDHIEEALKTSAVPGLWPVRMDISGCVTEADGSSGSNAGARSSTPQQKQNPGDSIRPSQELQNLINDAAPVPVVEGPRSIGEEDEEDENLMDSNKKVKRDGSLVKRQQLDPEENEDAQARPITLNRVKPVASALNLPEVDDPECIGVKGLTESIRTRTPRKFSAGALGDSGYEYFIKEYLLLGGLSDQYARLYRTSSESIKSNLLYRPLVKGDPDILFSGNLIVASETSKTLDLEMSHLSCFLGGMFALGSKALQIPADLAVASKLAEGCYWAYNATNTGIMPENFHVRQCTTPECHWVDPRFEGQEGMPQNIVKRENETDLPLLPKRRLVKRQDFGGEAPFTVPEQKPSEGSPSPDGNQETGAQDVSEPPAQSEQQPGQSIDQGQPPVDSQVVQGGDPGAQIADESPQEQSSIETQVVPEQPQPENVFPPQQPQVATTEDQVPAPEVNQVQSEQQFPIEIPQQDTQIPSPEVQSTEAAFGQPAERTAEQPAEQPAEQQVVPESAPIGQPAQGIPSQENPSEMSPIVTEAVVEQPAAPEAASSQGIPAQEQEQPQQEAVPEQPAANLFEQPQETTPEQAPQQVAASEQPQFGAPQQEVVPEQQTTPQTEMNSEQPQQYQAQEVSTPVVPEGEAMPIQQTLSEALPVAEQAAPEGAPATEQAVAPSSGEVQSADQFPAGAPQSEQSPELSPSTFSEPTNAEASPQQNILPGGGDSLAPAVDTTASQDVVQPQTEQPVTSVDSAENTDAQGSTESQSHEQMAPAASVPQADSNPEPAQNSVPEGENQLDVPKSEVKEVAKAVDQEPALISPATEGEAATGEAAGAQDASNGANLDAQGLPQQKATTDETVSFPTTGAGAAVDEPSTESTEQWADTPEDTAKTATPASAAPEAAEKVEQLVKDDIGAIDSDTDGPTGPVIADAASVAEGTGAWDDAGDDASTKQPEQAREEDKTPSKESDQTKTPVPVSSPATGTTEMSKKAVDSDADRWAVGGWYDQPRSFLSQDGRYLLRPEALESIFVMYRITGDKKWQEKGWEMFSAIAKYCKTATAFSAIKDVTDPTHITFLNEMESFWMAETLKYAYLLFSDPGLVSLDDYVFNTEAHPFLRPGAQS